MSAVRLTLVVAATAMVLAGCASTPSSRCGSGEQAAIHDQLYFGTMRRSGPITADEWTAFVADTVTRKLPAGFTVWDGTGQWLDAKAGIVKETTHVLSVAHPDDARSDQVVLDIAAAYRARFDQHGVYRIRTAVCSSDLQGKP